MTRGITAGARLWWGIPLLVALLWAAGSLVAPSIPGIPQAPEFVGWSLPILRYARDIASFLAVGALVVGGLLVTPSDQRIRGWAVGWSAAWLVLSATVGLLTISEIRAQGLTEVLDPSVLVPFLLDSVVGRVLLGQVLAAAFCAMVVWATGARRWMWAAVVVAVSGAALPGFVGHGGIAGGHEAASISLALHLGAIALWVGGLAVVVSAVVVRPELAQVVLPKFSLLALWCVIVAAETGLLNASMRVGTASALVGTWYGSLVLGKAVLLAWLVRLGWRQRQQVVGPMRVEGGPGSPRALLVRFAGWELLLMGAAVAASITMARIGPAIAEPGAFSPIALSLIAVAAPVVIAQAWTPTASWASWVRKYPEVPSFVLAFAIVEIAGLRVLSSWLGLELGTGIGALLLLGIGFVWAVGALGDRGAWAFGLMAVLWPAAALASGALSQVDTGFGAFLVGLAVVEGVIGLLLVQRRRSAAAETSSTPSLVAG